MSERECSRCRHFEEFPCRVRGVCTRFARSTRIDSSCLSYEIAEAQRRRDDRPRETVMAQA